MHGLIFENRTIEEIQTKWEYGFVHFGNYVDNSTINYIVKYVTKIDKDHKGFEPVVLCSPAIGKEYTKKVNFKKNMYNGEMTKEYYTDESGHRIALPIYYRNKAYTEEERELLWIEKLNKKTRFVAGIEVKVDDYDRINKILEHRQKENKKLGYGDDSGEWKKVNYNVSLRELNKKYRDIDIHGDLNIQINKIKKENEKKYFDTLIDKHFTNDKIKSLLLNIKDRVNDKEILDYLS